MIDRKTLLFALPGSVAAVVVANPGAIVPGELIRTAVLERR
jgi:hypothetical protein